MPDKGYRRIRDDLERYHGIKVNDKRVLHICKKTSSLQLNIRIMDVHAKLQILNFWQKIY
ncbi:MAG: IS3 family transposase [Candidatus Fimimorpha sp.]